MTPDISTSLYDALNELARRGQQAGLIRADLVTDDLPRLIAMLHSVLWTMDTTSDGWRRYVALVLDAISINERHPLPPWLLFGMRLRRAAGRCEVSMTNPVPTVDLGDGLTVSAVGFGAMALTPIYGEVDDTESLATLNHCVDAGVSFIDTANIYGGGDNERLIAKLLENRRDEVTLATKFGITGNPAAGRRSVRGDAGYVHQCIDESLQRLNTDVVDLYSCTAATRTCRSRKLSARWPNW